MYYAEVPLEYYNLKTFKDKFKEEDILKHRAAFVLDEGAKRSFKPSSKTSFRSEDLARNPIVNRTQFERLQETTNINKSL